LDQLLQLGCVDWSCALMYITDGETDEHLQLLDDGLIKQLIADKWKTFARVSYVLSLIEFFFQNLPQNTARVFFIFTSIYRVDQKMTQLVLSELH